MAELTHLESKLAEVFGLAKAAQESTSKVIKLVDDEEVSQTLERMREEAAEAEERCAAIGETLEGKKTALEEKAMETKKEAAEMMKTYLGDDADGLDGLEFLMMAEAAEVGHAEVLGAMNEQARNPEIQELVDWVTPVQQRHFEATRQGALKLARQEDPASVAS
jgi:rubrerythrin